MRLLGQMIKFESIIGLELYLDKLDMERENG
jgi:hypothetical protein